MCHRAHVALTLGLSSRRGATIIAARTPAPKMIVLTDHVQHLVRDIAGRLPELSHVEPDRVLVFARTGRTGAAGPVASCHCVARRCSDRGYFYWRHIETNQITRRTRCVSRRSPVVLNGETRVTHLVSLSLPRYCDQDLAGSSKGKRYPTAEPWVAKLDTLIHELYHIAPKGGGLRLDPRRARAGVHSRAFYDAVTRLTLAYLDVAPSGLLSVLRHDFESLQRAHGAVAGHVFSTYPAFPREYWTSTREQVDDPRVPLVEMRRPSKVRFEDDDRSLRVFMADGTSRPVMHRRADQDLVLPSAA